jgi:hypothetical protein
MPGSLSGNWNGVFSSDGITAAAHFPAIVRENLVGIYLWGSLTYDAFDDAVGDYFRVADNNCAKICWD